MSRAFSITCSVFLFGLILGFSGCEEEELCDANTCPFGNCYEGECLDDSSYVAALGPEYFQDAYVGSWLMGEICPGTSDVDTVEIVVGTLPDLLEFSALGPERRPVRLEFFGTDLRIPDQLYGNGTISGDGGIDTTAQIITLDLRIDEGLDSTTCLATFENL